jgi:DamX protein
MKRISTQTRVTEKACKFYATPELTQRINLIQYLLQNSEQLLLVLADEGRGKTTLLNQIVSNANDHWKIFTPASNPALTETALISTLLSAFNVRPEGKTPTALRDTLRSHIAATRYNGQLPILLVDDAHMLPLETLSFLVRLVMTGEPQTRMRVLLFCEPQITSVFAAPEFEIMRNTLIHTLDVPVFNEKQVRGYSQFCSSQEGYGVTTPFSDSQIRQLFRESEGVPGHLQALVQKLFDELPERPQQSSNIPASPKPRLWGRHAMLGGILLGVFLVLILIATWVKSLLFAPEEADIKKPESVLELPTATSPENPSTAINTATSQTTTSQQTPPAYTGPEFPPPAPLARGDTQVVITPRDSDIASISTASDDSALEQTAQVEETPPSVPLEPPKPPPAQDKDEIFAQLKPSSWLEQLDGDTYTLQILSTYEKSSIPRFIRRYGLENSDLGIFATTRNNKPYYKLVLGFYPDRAKAVQALQRMPSALRNKTSPWPRTMSNIQAEIERVRKTQQQ